MSRIDSKLEVFARFGLASYQAQCVERELGTLVATVANSKFDTSALAERERAYGDAFESRTVDLARHLRKARVLDATLEGEMTWARKTRNWLHHSYFRDRGDLLLTESGREEMMSELSEVASRLDHLDKALAAITHAWGERRGISATRIQEELRKLSD